MENEIAVLLHNVRSAHNVGSIFRTADGAGVGKIYLTGITPLPTDRFGRVQREIGKVALGAERTLKWEHHTSPSRVIAMLRREGWKIVGVEQDARAKDYRLFKPRSRTILVLGNEVNGLPKRLRDACDVLLEIPMHGNKESLNVAVAAGIVLFSLNR